MRSRSSSVPCSVQTQPFNALNIYILCLRHFFLFSITSHWDDRIHFKKTAVNNNMAQKCSLNLKLKASCHYLCMTSMKLVIPLHSLYWSIHTKDESKRRTAFTFTFAVNWLWRRGVTTSFGIFFNEIKCNGMTSFIAFMSSYLSFALELLTICCQLTVHHRSSNPTLTSKWQHCWGAEILQIEAVSFLFVKLSGQRASNREASLMRFWCLFVS